MGILVNAVLLRILVEIENQEDISEVASHRLNELCKMMHDLEGLFIDETGEVSLGITERPPFQLESADDAPDLLQPHLFPWSR